MKWVDFDDGTVTPTVGTEETITECQANATYILRISLDNMVAGDETTLAVYVKVDGANERVVWAATYSGVQTNPIKSSPGVSVMDYAKFTINQLTGTARDYAWKMLAS